MAKLKVVPLTLQQANDYVYDHHRHNKPVTGHRFSIGAVLEEGDILGVAIVGRPVARALEVSQLKSVECAQPKAVPRMCVRFSMVVVGAFGSKWVVRE